MFTGQGSQYGGMARGLYEAEPVFRGVVDRCAAVVDGLMGGSLLGVLFAEGDGPEAGLLDQTGWTQPALLAVELGLVELWRSWGVVPSAVLGHSVGELAAAVVAGVVGVEDGLRLVVARGGLMQALPVGGAMVAVFAPVVEVESVVASCGGLVGVAAVNGPAHVVVSGAAADVDVVVGVFVGRGVRVQALTVSHAFHSPLMAPMLDDFAAVAATVSYHPPHGA